MEAIIYILGFAYIAIGSALVLYARGVVDAVKKMYQALPLKFLAAFPAVFGLLFLISATATIYPWFFRIIGLLGIGKAVVIFTNPSNLYSRLLDWYFGNVSDQAQRLFGIICLIFGTAIITWIK